MRYFWSALLFFGTLTFPAGADSEILKSAIASGKPADAVRLTNLDAAANGPEENLLLGIAVSGLSEEDFTTIFSTPYSEDELAVRVDNYLLAAERAGSPAAVRERVLVNIDRSYSGGVTNNNLERLIWAAEASDRLAFSLYLHIVCGSPSHAIHPKTKSRADEFVGYRTDADDTPNDYSIIGTFDDDEYTNEVIGLLLKDAATGSCGVTRLPAPQILEELASRRGGLAAVAAAIDEIKLLYADSDSASAVRNPVAPDDSEVNSWLLQEIELGVADAWDYNQLIGKSLKAESGLYGARYFNKAIGQLETLIAADEEMANLHRAMLSINLLVIGTDAQAIHEQDWRNTAALEIFRVLAESGDAEDILSYARAIYSGDYRGADPDAALPWFLRAAQLGNSDAAFRVGWMYSKGEGTSANISRALHWYEIASKAGDATAMFNLGIMYSDNQSAVYDPAASFRWHRSAAQNGVEDSYFFVALAHDLGQGTLENDAEANHWYQKCASFGDGHCQRNLGFQYSNGDGVRVDNVEAYKWLNLAAAQNTDGAAAAKQKLALRMSRDEISTAQSLSAAWASGSRSAATAPRDASPVQVSPQYAAELVRPIQQGLSYLGY